MEVRIWPTGGGGANKFIRSEIGSDWLAVWFVNKVKLISRGPGNIDSRNLAIKMAAVHEGLGLACLPRFPVSSQ